MNAKLENMPGFVHMVNNSSDMLVDVFEGNMKVIRFDYNSMNKMIKVPPKKKTEFQMMDHMSQHRARHVYPQHKGKTKKVDTPKPTMKIVKQKTPSISPMKSKKYGPSKTALIKKNIPQRSLAMNRIKL
ncbi:hypothetical protein KIW84_074594 [Lathyrus oleraceus]|uniref:Uncharacterized protein n=1 Tax=Pisum sativum TaxID=3888 RepID=A0A9D4VT81_PEA|nr:hypothetical protein KIW84_074594 [Pisum sativum]